MLGVACLLGLWALVCAAGWVRPQQMPSPASVLDVAGQMSRTGELPDAVLVSAVRVGAGLLIGVTVGTTLAMLVGLSRIGEYMIDSPVQMLRTMPAVALVPLFVIWFGIGETMKVSLIAWASAFPIYINVLGAIRSIDAGYEDLARSLKLRRSETVLRIVVPGCMPGFLVGLRYSVTVAWIVLIVAEQVNATSGLGYLTSQARLFYQTDVIIACLIAYACLGWLCDLAVRAMEGRLLRWRRPFPQR
jgi:sulfonate transport system permease protein